jgi:hypothetical protein
MLTALLQNLSHAAFFPKALLAPDELDLHPFSAAIRSMFARKPSRNSSAHLG